MKKYLKPILISVFLFSLIFIGPKVKAMSIPEIQAQIQALLQQVAVLQQELVTVQGGNNQDPAWCHTFSNGLRAGDTGDETYALSEVLIMEGLLSNNTYSFDEQLASAVVGFQEKYASDILAFYDLKHGTGYVGKTTRAKLNKLYGCGNVEPGTPTKPPSNSPLTLLSPNGGEAWEKNTIKEIKWADSTTSTCPDGADCSLLLLEYDIQLISYYPPCTGEICPMYDLPLHRIANSISGSSYSWSVGKIIDNYSVPNGSYTVRICQTNSNICDSSNRYFKIVRDSVINTPPVINPVSEEIFNIKIGQSISFSWNATDADKDNLVWSVSWGDGTGIASSCPVSNPQNNGGQLFKAFHAWQKAGVYTVKVTVSDCQGGKDDHIFNVTVRKSSSPLTLLSPNGGETWKKDIIQRIKWEDSTCSGEVNCFVALKYDLDLISYYPPCTEEVCPAMPSYTYKIANGIYGSSYNWLVGKTLDDYNVPDGSYTVQICQADSYLCDSSDSYFKIVTSDIGLNDLEKQLLSIGTNIEALLKDFLKK